MIGYNEVVVCDRYLDKSLKNKTRQMRQITSTEYDIHPEMKLTMCVKELLSSWKTKHDLAESGPMSLTCRFISLLGTLTLLMIDT